MLYDLGLLFTIAVCGWIVLDPLLSAASRGRALSVGCLGLCAGLWAAGELAVQHAQDAQALAGRRVLYLGGCFIGVAWLWVAAQAARVGWWQRAPWILAALAVPCAFFYSSLYWGVLWFSDWSVRPAERGPLFLAHLGYTWLLLLGGLHYLARAARRMRRAGSAHIALIASGIGVPMTGNVLYLSGALGDFDPTPILLGIAGLLFRFAIVDSGIAVYLPLARGDVLEQLEAGVLVADLDGEVVYANAAAHSLLGEDRLAGRALEDLVARGRSLPRRTLEVRRFALRSLVAEIGRGVVLTDRTEAERAARRLQLAARLEAVGFLTAGIAHEVNNPLAYIRANLALLEKLAHGLDARRNGDGLSPGVRELAHEAGDLVGETQEGVERIARLVERLRTFARHDPEGDQERELPLSRIAERAAAMARVGLPSDAIRVRVEPAPPVRGAESQLVQIVLNLLVNAIHASPGAPEIEVEVCAEEGGAALAVKDRGTGIPEAAFPHLFDPFFTTKPPGKGTGLGLSLSHDLARQHGGTLRAANREDGGAVFTLWLPAAPSARVD